MEKCAGIITMRWHKFGDMLPGPLKSIVVFDGDYFIDYLTDDRGYLIVTLESDRFKFEEDLPPYYKSSDYWIYSKDIIFAARLLAKRSILSEDLSNEDRETIELIINVESA